MSVINEKLADLQNKITMLPARDKRALLLLGGFMLAMLCYGLFLFHQYASKVQSNALAKQQELFWLRGQSSNIKVTQEQVNLPDLIEETARMQNIQVQTNTSASGNQSRVQFSASHQNAAVLGGFFARLEEQGVQFETMNMRQQSDMSLVAEATVIN